MNILSINNFKFSAPQANKNENTYTLPRFGLTMATPLLNDTVSFKGYKKAKTPFLDFVEHTASKDMDRLNRIATSYLDMLESVAKKLEPYGVSFCREYCEKNPVKSPESYASKVKRSKKFNVPDRIRATLFVKNPYDLSILSEQILPELSKRDFIITKTEGNLDNLIMKGYVPKLEEVSGKKDVLVPDLDIRLSSEDLKTEGLSSEFIYNISEPQNSGYEDIQMRLIRGFDPKKEPVQHELIILMGMNYAYAKHLESELVYSNLRKFNTLNIVNKGNENIESYKSAEIYIKLIKRLITTEISQKLFQNAKKLDYTGEKNFETITISEENKQLLDSYFNELESRINSYYRTARASKRISENTKKKFAAEMKEDKALLNDIRTNLDETIKFFNEKNYLQRPINFD